MLVIRLYNILFCNIYLLPFTQQPYFSRLHNKMDIFQCKLNPKPPPVVIINPNFEGCNIFVPFKYFLLHFWKWEAGNLFIVVSLKMI